MSELFHVLNRGVEKRDIFLDDSDRVRFIHNLYEFNDTTPATKRQNHDSTQIGHRMSDLGGKQRDRLVDIHGWCLMSNHYHLLLSERKEGGLSLFLRKLNVGFAKYVNERYERSGFLFQGRTKKILISSERHLHHILHYIHLNPLDMLEGAKEWRERKLLIEPANIVDYLGKYRWSSFKDYIGEKNFPSILTKELFNEILGDYKSNIMWHLNEIDATKNECWLA